MNNYKYLITIVCMLTQLCFCMEMQKTKITAFDNKEEHYSFSQSMVESSRVIHTKQQWHLFKEKYNGAESAPLLLKTIPSYKLELFSKALKAKDFQTHFTSLSHADKLSLMCVAGERELDAPLVLAKTLMCCCSSDVLNQSITSLFPLSDVGDYLQRLIILDNAEQKNFTCGEVESYADDICLVTRDEGNGYNGLPRILIPYFNGITPPLTDAFSDDFDSFFDNESLVYIENHTKNAQASYFITPVEPIDNKSRYAENKKRLWIKKDGDDHYVEGFIQHTNAINATIFSNDGKYLATSSEGPNGELILTDLKMKNDTEVSADTFLSGYTGSIGPVRFNHKSTILAAATEKNVYFWDVSTRSLRTKIDCYEGEIEEMCFSRNNTRLATVSFDEEAQSSILELWDVTDIQNIILIKTVISKEVWIDNISFSFSSDKLIIGTKKSVILLDALTGESILDTGIINEKASDTFSCVNALLMPYDMNILVTQTHSDNNENDGKHVCNVALWDINSGKCIATLLENKEHLLGIGVSAGGQSVIATAAPFDMIQVLLYDDNTRDCLKWIINKADLLQKYLLLRLYRAKKLNDVAVLYSDSAEYQILQSLPTEPNVKELVEKYLLKK